MLYYSTNQRVAVTVVSFTDFVPTTMVLDLPTNLTDQWFAGLTSCRRTPSDSLYGNTVLHIFIVWSGAVGYECDGK